MEEYSICNIDESLETQNQAAEILLKTFPKADMWPSLNEKESSDTVKESIADENICIGIKIDKQLIGWIGLRPMYEKTWELHPLAILPE
jgi:aminoglycoside 6'-N-acetyltransferase I